MSDYWEGWEKGYDEGRQDIDMEKSVKISTLTSQVEILQGVLRQALGAIKSEMGWEDSELHVTAVKEIEDVLP